MKGQNYVINKHQEPERLVDNQTVYTNWYTCVLYEVDGKDERVQLPFIPYPGLRIRDWFLKDHRIVKVVWDSRHTQFECEVHNDS